jgi:hypothetical protein
MGLEGQPQLEPPGMNDVQTLFLRQARSNHRVFELLRRAAGVEQSHVLHYLQMTTEMLAKAYAWKHSQSTFSHKVFVAFLRNLSGDRQACKCLGYEDQRSTWGTRLRECLPVARDVELLAPAVEQLGSNAEYPWPPAGPTTCPADYDFPVWTRLQTAAGRQLLFLVRELLDHAEEFF